MKRKAFRFSFHSSFIIHRFDKEIRMKRCPECERTYSDNTLQFCLEDGTELISEGETSADETLVMSAPPEGTDDQELATTKASSKETEAKTESASAAKAGKSPQGSKS